MIAAMAAKKNPREGGEQTGPPPSRENMEAGARPPKSVIPANAGISSLELPPRVKRETPAFAGVTVYV
jgi:hypothetical protein